jgi:hypothetical protein
MSYSGILRRVALVRTDVSEEPSSSIIRVTRIGEIGTTLAVTSNAEKIRTICSVFVTVNVGIFRTVQAVHVVSRVFECRCNGA